jgi:hypothetical protein
MTIFTVWAVYNHPKDNPHNFVARKWTVETKGVGDYIELPTSEIIESTSLQEIRRRMKKLNLTKIGRLIGDDPVIIETWL